MMSGTPIIDRAGTAEQLRLQQSRDPGTPWKLWGPYLSERQWGTVREDYSENGDAWGYFSHDQARSRAYHWGEDGVAGFSDEKQRLCFALALWNGKDPILKERMFGLTNSEGNHGEDVKEYYFYIDSTPTHSYMKMLYKYPQSEFPYRDLVETNRRRGRTEAEYELIDTGVFNEDRYFDVFVEYAKETPTDILVQISVSNRGPDAAPIRVLPTLWFRNVWTWWPETQKPSLRAVMAKNGVAGIAASDAEIGDYFLYCEGKPSLLFTENETNNQRIFGTPNAGAYVKDGINDFIVAGRREAVNPRVEGTKGSASYGLEVGPGETAAIRLRLTKTAPDTIGDPFGSRFAQMLERRQLEADEFYRAITPAGVHEDAARVMRQALAGMLWTKQYYFFDLAKWHQEHGRDPAQAGGLATRNREWAHMVNDAIISMPDKWEYPWFAAWDLAFHTIALSTVDIDFAQRQLELMLKSFYLHPTGQMPAYEWNFGDVNPPVHAWAAIFLHRTEQALGREPDLEFLTRVFTSLSLNFTWWTNRKDRFGKNLFEGGFLGLDNIGVFDRSAPLPTGGYLEQADATAWMALFCQNMLEIGVELAKRDPAYEDLATKFMEHFLWIGHAMNGVGPDGMWDEEDGFYYDVLRLPEGRSMRLKVRSIVGLLPVCAVTVIEPVGAGTASEPRADFCGTPAANAGSARHHSRYRAWPFRSRRARHHGSCEPGPAAQDPFEDARRGRVPQPVWYPRLVASSRGASLCVLRARPGIPSELSSRGVGHRHVRRQLQLARSDLDTCERVVGARPAAVLFVLRGHVQSRMSNRLRQHDEPFRGQPRDRQSTDPHFPPGPIGAATRVWRGREIPGRSALARLPPLLRVFPWR